MFSCIFHGSCVMKNARTCLTNIALNQGIFRGFSGWAGHFQISLLPPPFAILQEGLFSTMAGAPDNSPLSNRLKCQPVPQPYWAVSPPQWAVSRNLPEWAIFRVGFWQNGFFADFYFWAAGIFRGFCRRIFSPHLWGNPRHQTSQKTAPR